MNNKEEPKDLLAELEMLQRVLDNPGSSSFSEPDIPVLEDLFDGDIPVVNDPISEKPSVLRPVAPAPLVNPAPLANNVSPIKPVTVPEPEAAPSSVSPLNQILNKINRDGNSAPSPLTSTFKTPEAKAPVAGESTLTTKRAEIDQTMSQTSASLTSLLQRERIVDELVEELLPLIKGRLRSRIRDMLNGKEDT
ncbi:MAG: hypothetical protein VW258_08260 [Thalassolituus sp.]